MSEIEGIDDEKVACLALMRSGRVSANETRKLLTVTGSFVEVLREALGSHFFTDDFDFAMRIAKNELQDLSRQGIALAALTCKNYPRRAKDLSAPPLGLFWQGVLDLAKHDAVSIIGSRFATQAGLSLARETSSIFCANGVVVGTGLAAGIDSAAHKMALNGAQLAMGVIGTGLDVHYPKENAFIQSETARRGLLLTQFLPGTGPSKRNFPIRNATMSALTLCNIVIEAGEFSGTRSQVNAGLRIGRPALISTSVVNGTVWGKQLTDSTNDVYIFDTPGEAWSLFQNLRDKSEFARNF